MNFLELRGDLISFNGFEQSMLEGQTKVSVQRFNERLTVSTNLISTREEDRLSNDALVVDVVDGQASDPRLIALVRKCTTGTTLMFVKSTPDNSGLGYTQYVQAF